MRIIYFLGCKGTKFFFRSYFQHSITILRSATGFFYAQKGASVGRSFWARKKSILAHKDSHFDLG
ncbi:MAG: hypothetical protein C0412_22180 [Flavobacterium sp.]|nr:hypothetical protein [Flavobacterium sp.]